MLAFSQLLHLTQFLLNLGSPLFNISLSWIFVSTSPGRGHPFALLPKHVTYVICLHAIVIIMMCHTVHSEKRQHESPRGELLGFRSQLCLLLAEGSQGNCLAMQDLNLSFFIHKMGLRWATLHEWGDWKDQVSLILDPVWKPLDQCVTLSKFSINASYYLFHFGELKFLWKCQLNLHHHCSQKSKKPDTEPDVS